MMLTIRRYREDDAAAWDAFVAQSGNGNFFHTRRFLRYHPQDRFRDHSLLFLDGGRVRALLSAVDGEKEGRRVLVSHPGASYGGGLVLEAESALDRVDTLLSHLEDYTRREGFVGAHFLRVPPPVMCQSSSPDQRTVLQRRRWTLERSERDSSLLLYGLREGGVLERLDGRCRSRVRQAERAGLTVRETDDLPTYWEMLTATLRERHGAQPTHTLGEIQHLRSICPGDIRLFAAFRGERMLGGVVAVTLHEQGIYSLYMAQDYAHHGEHPLHLTIVELMKVCVREGRSVLHLGVSTEDNGRRLNEGLLAFKESFGAVPSHRESWFLTLS